MGYGSPDNIGESITAVLSQRMTLPVSWSKTIETLIALADPATEEEPTAQESPTSDSTDLIVTYMQMAIDINNYKTEYIWVYLCFSVSWHW